MSNSIHIQEIGIHIQSTAIRNRAIAADSRAPRIYIRATAADSREIGIYYGNRRIHYARVKLFSLSPSEGEMAG